MREGGVIVYNSEDFQLEEDGKSFGMRIDELAKSTGNPRAANMVILGAIAHLVHMPEHYLPEFVTKRFTRGAPATRRLIKGNIMALEFGTRRGQEERFQLGRVGRP